ncbi:MAG: tripartite tricarboxylate transporter permease [Rhodobacteraceae bacterium]|nr:tripartite tricarboxylate transporter permease [Paracoccaceae bacterium]MBR9822533.1 tripartite tricarboxylate transporter permease [Paracoccaceae bacterium]
MALLAAITGDTFNDLLLMTVLAPLALLALLALKMGPGEVLALMILAFAVLSALVGKSRVKGGGRRRVGPALRHPGQRPQTFHPGLIFGMFYPYDGLPLVSVAIWAQPGIGSTAAAFMSYAATKRTSKDPESFGKGHLHGIAAAETAKSAVAGAILIPLLTLGSPGSVAM